MIKFENPENGRYYYLLVQRDLLGDLVLMVYRGGNHGLSFCRTINVGDTNIIAEDIQKISKKRLKRGYKLIS